MHHAQTQMRLMPLEVGVMMKQRNTMFDAPCRDQTVNRFAHGNAFTPQHNEFITQDNGRTATFRLNVRSAQES